jgi:hypothetical protein
LVAAERSEAALDYYFAMCCFLAQIVNVGKLGCGSAALVYPVVLCHAAGLYAGGL